MIETDERAAAMDADGSLTDIDDDEPFMLADPATLVEERISQTMPRQRRRRSYTLLDQNGIRQSSTSLASSTHASNTSLLGMDFILGDSTTSLIQREAAAQPGLSTKLESRDRYGSESSPSKPTVDEHHRSSQSFSRLRSEPSFASIGLALEPSYESKEEDGRDLVTPPPLTEMTYCPPPLSDGDNIENTPVSSVFLSKSNDVAVQMAIARMEFQNGSPGVGCSS
jgi:hypothetical protein